MDKKSLSRLVKFAERSKGLEIREKIKLVLFLSHLKPNAEIILKIDSKDLDEKFEFERLLKKHHLLFSVSRARSYEEIKKIKNNKVIWEIKGTYYIYDLFSSQRDQQNFNDYLSLLKEGRRLAGDKIIGIHYGYPLCCIKRFIKELDPFFLKRNYTYWSYYKKQQDLDHRFPFVFHRPCSLDCKKSAGMNKKYETTLQKISKKIYKEYINQSRFKGRLIVGEISDVEVKNQSIWPKKEGYEYELIFKKPFRRYYYLVSFLSRKEYEKGQLLKGEVILQYDYAKVDILKKKKKIVHDLHHERKLPLLGEVTLS